MGTIQSILHAPFLAQFAPGACTCEHVVFLGLFYWGLNLICMVCLLCVRASMLYADPSEYLVCTPHTVCQFSARWAGGQWDHNVIENPSHELHDNSAQCANHYATHPPHVGQNRLPVFRYITLVACWHRSRTKEIQAVNPHHHRTNLKSGRSQLYIALDLVMKLKLANLVCTHCRICVTVIAVWVQDGRYNLCFPMIVVLVVGAQARSILFKLL